MGPSAFELPIFVLARVEPRTLLSERLVPRKLVRCNTDGDRVADDAQGHMFVRRTVRARAKKKYPIRAFGRRLVPEPRLFEPPLSVEPK